MKQEAIGSLPAGSCELDFPFENMLNLFTVEGAGPVSLVFSTSVTSAQRCVIKVLSQINIDAL